MSEESNKLGPISAVGIVSSLTKIPDGYYVVTQTTDGSDADLWKDGLFKSKVTRYLCFSRKTEPEVVADMKLIDIKDPVPESFTPVQETLDKKEAAMRKRRLCVKMSSREAAEAAVCDIQITAKFKYQLVNYTCVGEINNMGIWYRMGDVPWSQSSQQTRSAPKTDALYSTIRYLQSVVDDDTVGSPSYNKEMIFHSNIIDDIISWFAISRPQCQQQNNGIYTMTALDDVPFMVSEKFHAKPQQMQQVNLMGITIKSLAEIEEEFHYNFGTELSIVP